MGGSYNYLTTACVGAGNRPATASPWSGGGDWTCRAESRSGASGWSNNYATEAEARRRSVIECYKYSRGQTCYVRSCRTGTREVAQPLPVQPPPQLIPPPSHAVYDCDVCYRKLLSDTQSAWASNRVRTYVSQALAGYSNCKLKAGGICLFGDILAQSLINGCKNFTAERDYRLCVGRIVSR
jgi:hypothetical protein